MNRLELQCYSTILDNCVMFVVLTTTCRPCVKTLLAKEGYTKCELLDTLTLDEDYKERMPCYILKEDKHLRALFAKYREEIGEHYKDEADCWPLFNDEFGLDI